MVECEDGEREDAEHHGGDSGEERLPPADAVDEREGGGGGDHLRQAEEDGGEGRAELGAEADLPEDVVGVVDDVGLPRELLQEHEAQPDEEPAPEVVGVGDEGGEEPAAAGLLVGQPQPDVGQRLADVGGEPIRDHT